jgi:hypothetical protein
MRETLTDKLEAFFKARPLTWIDGEQLGKVAGKYAWRSRVSDLRTSRGMCMMNRQDHLRAVDGSRFTISWYRYVPPVGQLDLLSTTARPADAEAEYKESAPREGLRHL